ncbi:YceD family protein [Moraxella oblonga]|uniref:YceD family protein n=1 Tax=Moraxella oblonga TaxID=200413 RepID=UPI0008373BF0|nr:YceD family protein [Moraxella oblonga]
MTNFSQPTAMPTEIALDKWSDVGFEWQGIVPITQFERLADEIDSLGDDTLDISFALINKNGLLWLNYQIEATLLMPCQRCLTPMAINISNHYRLAILENEDKIRYLHAIEPDADYVLIDEICEPDSRKMLPVADLLEDELLLAIPLAPRHSDCELLTDSVGEVPNTPKENPFAMLEQLRGKL